MKNQYGVSAGNSEYLIVCNGKNMKTPGGNPFKVSTQALAEAIAAEWQAMGDRIRKEKLKLSPIAYVAIDLAGPRREAVLADVVPYIDTDLVSYRAGDIDELLVRQQKTLDPLLAWLKERYDIALKVTGGVMPVAQPPENRKKLAQVLAGFDDWKLAAFAVAVKPLGSAVLALALVEGRRTAQEAFACAHLEEAYETEKWGLDDEKEQSLAVKRDDVQAVTRFLELVASR